MINVVNMDNKSLGDPNTIFFESTIDVLQAVISTKIFIIIYDVR